MDPEFERWYKKHCSARREKARYSSAGSIVEITPKGIRTDSGDFDLDAIVFATGYDAVTGAVLSIDIRSRGGKNLADRWTAGPRTYLGLMTAGFPNLFLVTGPGRWRT